jgi:class 3 adenylate cyclase
MDFPLSNSWPPEFANGLLTIGMRQTDLQAALSNASVSQTMGGIALGGDDQLIALVAPSDRSIVFGVESARSEVAQLLSTSLLHGTNSTFQAVFQGTNVHVNITAPRWQDRGAGWRVLVLSPKPSVFSLDNQATRQTFFLALTALLLSVWLGLRIARSITGPAATLAGYAQSLQTGDHQPEKIGALRHREDEFGSLANSFLDMTEILLARQEDLKSLVEQRTTDLREQSESLAQKNEEAERLLLNILPPSIMRRLQSGEVRVVDEASNVTIIFCDLVGFTKMSEELPADQLVDILNTLFSEFDRLTLVHGVEKIKTIGDAYMAVAGLPESRPDHAHAAMEFALAMQDVLGALNRSLESTLAIRIGMNSGPVTAGIIGTHKFAYDIWGAAVNTASRMESAGIPGRIQVSGATYEQISAYYRFDDRGEIEIKGKGKMKAYLYLERLGVKPTPGSALASTSEPEPETSWGNILQADVSLGSIKALLSKDLFAKDSTSAKPRRKPGEDEDLDPPGNQPV